MKNETIEVLRDRSARPQKKFNAALKLYLAHDHANPVLARHYNQVGYSPESLKSLCYDLQQLYGISNTELRAKQSDLDNLRDSKEPETFLSEILLENLEKIDLEKANYASELRPLANELADLLKIELVDQKKLTLTIFLETLKEKYVSRPKTLNPEPGTLNPVPESVKLRDEFPFLDKADCPDKLKILVADKISAYKKAEAAHEELAKNETEKHLSPEQEKELSATAVENFELNELVYRELNYFKEHNEILGEHPIFAEEVAQREVDELSDNDAHKTYRNLATYISREKKNLDKAKSDETRLKIQAKIDEFQAKRDLIAKKLGLDEK